MSDFLRSKRMREQQGAWRKESIARIKRSFFVVLFTWKWIDDAKRSSWHHYWVLSGAVDISLQWTCLMSKRNTHGRFASDSNNLLCNASVNVFWFRFWLSCVQNIMLHRVMSNPQAFIQEIFSPNFIDNVRQITTLEWKVFCRMNHVISPPFDAE